MNGSGRRQPSSPATPGESHEHRLRHVILLVAQPEYRRVETPKFVVKKSVSGSARLRFTRVVHALRPSSDAKTNFQSSGNFLAKTFILVSHRSAQAMVEMKGHEPPPPIGKHRPKNEQQGQ